LRGADTCDHYALDAEAADDERLAAFFRDAQSAQVRIAERGKELLGIVDSAAQFETKAGMVSGGEQTNAGSPTGRGIPPASGAQRTQPGEENLGGRGVPPVSDASRRA
jgi:hypothetical protein